MIRYKTWLWLSVSKAGAQVTVLSTEVSGLYCAIEKDNVGHLAVASVNSAIYFDGTACYPLKPALRGSN